MNYLFLEIIDKKFDILFKFRKEKEFEIFVYKIVSG